MEFLKQAQQQHKEFGLHELLGEKATFSSPISAGVSCLAALPRQVRHLVPEPYNQIDQDTVEEYYAECMNPNDNVFDMHKFERLCDDKIRELGLVNGNSRGAEDHFWLALSKSRKPVANPINPPPPFSKRLSELRHNDRIQVSRIIAFSEPRKRAVWNEGTSNGEIRLQAASDIFLKKFEHLDDIRYKQGYRMEMIKKRNKKKKRGVKMNLKTTAEIVEEKPPTHTKKKRKGQLDVAERMRSFQIEPAPTDWVTSKDGQTPVACLKQLHDSGLIGPVNWVYQRPSTSAYAAFNPQEHECVSLTVSKGSDPAQSALGENLFYEQDRDINHVSRQAIKQHLASFALCDITGPGVKWSELTFKDLRHYIVSRQPAETSVDVE